MESEVLEQVKIQTVKKKARLVCFTNGSDYAEIRDSKGKEFNHYKSYKKEYKVPGFYKPEKNLDFKSPEFRKGWKMLTLIAENGLYKGKTRPMTGIKDFKPSYR